MNNNTENLSAKETQLEILQSRITTHGNKLWQLPFSYAGVVALSANLAGGGKSTIPAGQVFFALGIAGLVVIFCMYGAYEGYARTAVNMQKLENELGLTPTTRNYLSHTLPYFLLAVLSVLATIYLGFA